MEGFGVFYNTTPHPFKESFESLKIQPFRDSFSTLNKNFLGIESNSSLNNVRTKRPSISTLSSINDSPITIKSDADISNFNKYNSPITPTSTLNINKKLPEIPNTTLKNNVSDLYLKNVESSQTNNKSNLLRKFKSLPFLRVKNPYSDSIVKHLDAVWKNIFNINDKNEIVIPDNIKNLDLKQLNLNNSKSLLDIVNKNVNYLFEDNPKLDKTKTNFWIEYDANKVKSKGFIFVEINSELGNRFEFIGAKNKFELVSYLNNEIHKIDGDYSKRNIILKNSLKKNIEENYLWSFTHWCTILNKEYLKI